MSVEQAKRFPSEEFNETHDAQNAIIEYLKEERGLIPPGSGELDNTPSDPIQKGPTRS